MVKRKKIGVIDFETTGLSSDEDSVREMGVVIAYADNFEYITHWKRDIACNESSNVAFRELNRILFGCTVITYNSAFDAGFLKKGLKLAGVKADYHILCAMSMAAMYLRQQKKLNESKSLENMCRLLGVAVEPKPHKAIYGALAAHAVLKKIFEPQQTKNPQIQDQFQKRSLNLVA
jgi:DNA polymerase III epsilon subunit-like protein